MNRVEIVKFQKLHAYEILDRNVREVDLKLARHPDWKDWVEAWDTRGPAYTLMADGQPVACAGVVEKEWHKGEAWALLSRSAFNFKLAMVRAMKKGIQEVVDSRRFRRIEAVADVNHGMARELLEALGFTCDTPKGMEKYGPNGEKSFLYARVK